MQVFEDRLLAELKAVVAERTAVPASARSRRRPWLVMLTAGTAAAAMAIGIPVLTGPDAPRANAVVRDPDGSIRLYIRDYRNPEVISSRLRGFGVEAVVDLVPNGMQCRKPRGKIEPNDGQVVTVMSPEDDDSDGDFNRLHPDRIKPGQTLVLEIGYTEFGDDSSMASMYSGLATGPVAPCVLEPGPKQAKQLPDGGVGG